jgi:5'(3')-deoxyribonucleotidase|tara:strand:+ start:1770 stop:3716 length:1947 start_codon:yes stop_codon:yes gene_type:complete
MKIANLLNEGVGRIVKGVNTTPDVGVNQLPIEAAKFGSKVSKDGVPPIISAINLGILKEGIAVRFERTPDFDILHIKQKGKNRVELRGKPGYERGGYDANDKLHQVLDKLGKAANISDLMNGEVQNINPGHPDAEKATKTTKDILSTEGIEEALGSIDKNSEIYVDMDGVLADFFGEWAKLMKVSHWTELGKEHSIPDALQAIRDSNEFWLNIPMLPKAKELLLLIKKLKGSYYICSSPLADDPNSVPHKEEWIRRHLSFFPPKKVFITSNKPKYALRKDGTANILIDDFGKNINAWQDAGGVGFKYKDHKFERTVGALKKQMTEDVTKPQLDALERVVDRVFGQIGIDVEFTRHFIDRVNDDRNGQPITIQELGRLFAKEYKRWGKPIAKMGPDTQAVMKDLESDINIPFALNWNGKELELVAKTVMRKKNFKTPNQEFRVENKVNEALDNPYPFKLEGPAKDGTWVGKANTPNGPLVMDFDGNKSQDDFSIDFAVDSKMGSEGTGDAFRIFATVVAIMNEWIKRVGIERVVSFDFNADKEEHDSDGRSKLYDRFAKKLASQLGWSVRKSITGNGSTDFFALQNPNPQTNENFADGKKKGKSKPGRVKKSGASCNGSVTDLRKRAKNASGEKAKMYHWCANMKSGRQ